MANLNFKVGSGRLATDRYDFQNHVDGYSFRHNATAIDVIPSLTLGSTTYTDVYDLLAAITGTIDGGGEAGFIVVGDGYDTYHLQTTTPSAPFDPSVPTFDAYLNDLFNNPLNPNYARIVDGAVVVIKSGTYTIANTVDVPSGVSIWGEGFGTKIVNQTSSPLPLFKVISDTTRIPDYGSVDGYSAGHPEAFMFAKETQFFNFVIADNFVEPKFTGDTSYFIPQNDDSVTPLISVEEGSHFTAEYVKFIGKTTFSGSTLNAVTSFAVKTDNSTPVTTGTIVNIKNCFIDGFSIAVQTTSLGGTNDHFVFEDNYVRTYGFLNSDLTLVQNNCILKATGTNISVQNNYIYGFGSNNGWLLYIYALAAGSVVLQSYARIIVANNNISVDKSSNSVLIFSGSPFSYLVYDASILISAPNKVTSLTYANNFAGDNQFSVTVNSTTPQFAINSTGVNINNKLNLETATILSNPYVCDNGTNDLVLFVNTSTTAITISLPDATLTKGRILIIKDSTGNASSHHITLSLLGSQTLDGANPTKIISTNYGTITMISNSVNWLILSQI